MVKPFVPLMFVLVGVAFHSASLAQDQEHVVTVMLLDPRIVTNTSETIRIQWQDEKTDVIASRVLTKTQTRELKKLTEIEFSSDDNVPYCGHYPSYAIVYKLRSGRIVKIETICGLCKTWATAGELRLLKETDVLKLLSNVLPLPNYFADPDTAKERVIFADNKKVPHFELE